MNEFEQKDNWILYIRKNDKWSDLLLAEFKKYKEETNIHIIDIDIEKAGWMLYAQGIRRIPVVYKNNVLFGGLSEVENYFKSSKLDPREGI